MSSRKQRRAKKAQRKKNKQKSMHLVYNGQTEEEYVEHWKHLNKQDLEHLTQMSHKAYVKNANGDWVPEDDPSMKEPKKPKPIHHDDIIQVPYDWEVTLTDPVSKRKTTLKSVEKKKAMDLYVQGRTLFLVKDGLTQKLTPYHFIVIIDAKKKRFQCEYAQLVEWTHEHEEKERELKLK